jgi:hypothetical protein
MSDHVGDLPVLGEFAEHLAVGGAAQHAVAAVLDKLALAIPLLLSLLQLLNPSHCTIDRGDDLPPPLRCYRAA